MYIILCVCMRARVLVSGLKQFPRTCITQHHCLCSKGTITCVYCVSPWQLYRCPSTHSSLRLLYQLVPITTQTLPSCGERLSANYSLPVTTLSMVWWIGKTILTFVTVLWVKSCTPFECTCKRVTAFTAYKSCLTHLFNKSIREMNPYALTDEGCSSDFYVRTLD